MASAQKKPRPAKDGSEDALRMVLFRRFGSVGEVCGDGVGTQSHCITPYLGFRV